ncbi:hypothetical protein R3P38DRAFT_3236742 [Favolaschia claudopus]|uniref:Uncharacterized protein n=1 Tax=Favolaschia claudopus TaxID=2862362 RepID=A0AAV9ZCS2_9AGAR
MHAGWIHSVQGFTGRALQRNGAQRPSDDKPCGTVDIASNIGKAAAIPVTVGADGASVSLNMTNYKGGADGSRKVSVIIDPTGTGKNFVKADVAKNGDPYALKEATGSNLITVALPAGTKCTGAKEKNHCLVFVKSTAGFGACTVASSSPSPAVLATRVARFPRAEARAREIEEQERSLRGNPLFAATLL